MLAAWAPNTKAGSLPAEVDFSCSGTFNCHGMVTGSELSWSGSGISVTASSLNFGDGTSAGEAFTMTFSTNSSGTGTMEIFEDDETLIGTIVSTNAVTCGSEECLTFSVNWTANGEVPAAGSGGTTVTVVLAGVTNCAVASVDASVLPTSEPSSLFLMGSGLLVLGGAIRRRIAGYL